MTYHPITKKALGKVVSSQISVKARLYWGSQQTSWYNSLYSSSRQMDIYLFFNKQFLNYRYKSSQKSTDWSGVKKPIYLSKLGNNFAEWSASWAGYLITKVREPCPEFNWREIVKEMRTFIWMHSTHSRYWNICAVSGRNFCRKRLLIESLYL